MKQKTEREIELGEGDDYINDLKKNLTSPTLITLLSQKSGRATMWRTSWTLWTSLKSLRQRCRRLVYVNICFENFLVRIEEREEHIHMNI